MFEIVNRNGEAANLTKFSNLVSKVTVSKGRQKRRSFLKAANIHRPNYVGECAEFTGKAARDVLPILLK